MNADDTVDTMAARSLGVATRTARDPSWCCIASDYFSCRLAIQARRGGGGFTVVLALLVMLLVAITLLRRWRHTQKAGR